MFAVVFDFVRRMLPNEWNTESKNMFDSTKDIMKTIKHIQRGDLMGN